MRNTKSSARFTIPTQPDQQVAEGPVSQSLRESVEAFLNPTPAEPYQGGVDKATVAMANVLIHGSGRSPAPTFLDEAVGTMKARAQLRDQPAGERSMEKTVAIFNAWTGNNLSVEDGWRFMLSLKQAREIQGFYNRDDYVDGAAYFALLGEEESANTKRQKP